MADQQQGVYYVDIVMCIDATGSMSPVINEVKKNATSIHERFLEGMEEEGKDVEKLRIKVITFRDYKCDAEPMKESKFFVMPDEVDEFNAYVNGIEVKGGGDLPENALEAISLALKSDWVTESGVRKRHAIIVFTDAEALKFSDRADCAGYPEGMPKDLAELGAWWEGTSQEMGGSYDPIAGRLVVFAPNAYPWSDIQAWNRYWPSFSPAGAGLEDVDIQNAIDLLVGSC